MRTFLSRHALKRDKRGIAAVEFAVIAPVFLMILMGGMDFGHTLYVQAVVQGVVQKAARDSALENGGLTAEQDRVDAKVRSSIADINHDANVQITRRFYRTFSTAAAAQAETWTDSNANGRCDNGEIYSDANLNNTWDPDGADGGQGNARDVTIYKVTMTYPRLFPTNTLIGFPANVTVTAQQVLANQPFNDQQSYGAPVARNCP
jgi:Flp pilus assembly protein TadG